MVRFLNRHISYVDMDVIRLLNEGKREASEHLDKGVYRVYYSLNGSGRVPIIEKNKPAE